MTERKIFRLCFRYCSIIKFDENPKNTHGKLSEPKSQTLINELRIVDFESNHCTNKQCSSSKSTQSNSSATLKHNLRLKKLHNVSYVLAFEILSIFSLQLTLDCFCNSSKKIKNSQEACMTHCSKSLNVSQHETSIVGFEFFALCSHRRRNSWRQFNHQEIQNEKKRCLVVCLIKTRTKRNFDISCVIHEKDKKLEHGLGWKRELKTHRVPKLPIQFKTLPTHSRCSSVLAAVMNYRRLFFTQNVNLSKDEKLFIWSNIWHRI